MSSDPQSRNDKVIVLDRDGTIVVDRHYLSSPEDLQFEPGAEVGLRRMVKMGYRLIVITNQSGVARGFFSPARLEEIHVRLRAMLDSIGAPLEAIYACPHSPEAGCECRKPRLGLMQRAAQELGFEMSRSIVIGDKDSDVEFGHRAGATTILIREPRLRSESTTLRPDYAVANLTEAADIISSMSSAP